MPAINPFRCDQCIKNHKKCSKLKPTCLECSNKGLECTYLKKPKYSRWNTEFEESLVKYSLKEKKTRLKRCKNIGNKVTKWVSSNNIAITEFSILKLPADFDQGVTPLGIIHKIPRFQLLDNLMTLVQYPSPFKPSNGLNLFLKLVEKLDLLCARKKSTNKEIILQRPDSLPLFQLLEQSVKSYFAHSNVSFPLFIEEKFDFYNKPWELRFAIMATGLSYMKKNKFTEYLLDYFSNKLKDRLSNFHNIKPSLELIQTLILLAVRLFAFPWVVVLRDTIFDFCDRVSTMLGLYNINNNLSVQKNLERALVFSSLTFNMTSNALISGGILRWPIKPKSLISIYRKILSNSSYADKLGSNAVNRVILGAFYCDISNLFFSLSILKRNFLDEKTPKDELKKIRSSILQRITLLKLNYINAYNQCHSSFDYQSYISFFCHYLRYYCYSLSFYHPSYNTNPDDIHANNKDLNLINNTLRECHEVIKYASILPTRFMDIQGIAFTSQCSIFALRYKHLSKHKYKTIGSLGIEYLKKDNNTPSMNMLSKFNLYLINIVEDSVK